MKKAKIILSTVVLLAAIGGALAFKTMKFNGLPVWKLTKSITTLGTVYFTAGADFCTSLQPTRFFTDSGVETTVLSNSGPTVGQIQLTDGLGHTITIGNQPCVNITDTYTQQQD